MLGIGAHEKRGDRWPWPGLVLASLAALYGATWSGRYFHDSAVFIGRLERGLLAWVHAVYLPLAELVRLADRPSPLPAGDGDAPGDERYDLEERGEGQVFEVVPDR